ncbi:MAG: NADH-quinone oxidoreductase subunit N [Acidimicrobiia bacterium]|nr:NADH-quinone oxidoreductase subunit N [Acidimicrobiia bacterium]
MLTATAQGLLAQDAAESVFVRPPIDWHAFAPELVLLGWGALVTVIDIIGLERTRRFMPALTGIGFLLAMIPVLTLWDDGTTRVLFQGVLENGEFDGVGAYVVDRYALVLKGLFLLSGYVVVLLSTNYMAEGDYYDSEYYQLMAASVLGMLVMTSARDLISIFVALELLSIPAYLMAAWRKRDLRSNEAGLKYMLMGVFASAIMLYGMSLLYGVAGDTRLVKIAEAVSVGESRSILTLAILFTIIGFGFKVSAVPFHTWAPDTYEGAPTPLTAFLAVASKAAGFVALVSIVVIAFPGQSSVVEPFIWILAAATMTIGNLIALRQTNVVRMLAYSGVAQAGYMLAPLAVYGSVPDSARAAVVTYLVIYAAMNLGAFAVVIAAARKTRSGEIESYGGMFNYAPGLTVAMTVFLFSLAGVPPMGGWLAKWQVFSALLEADTTASIVLAVIAAVNTVIAAFYYLNVAKQMWFMPVPDGDESPVSVPAPLVAALGITVAATIVAGVTGFVPDITNFVEAAQP